MKFQFSNPEDRFSRDEAHIEMKKCMEPLNYAAMNHIVDLNRGEYVSV